MAMEFGMRRGLAVDIDWQARRQDALQLYSMKRQLEKEQEIKAKMFADDVKYKNAVNPKDATRINEKLRGKIQEVSAWMEANPGWERDTKKRIEYDQYVRNIVEDPLLIQGKTTDQGLAEFSKFIADPKNADLKTSEWLANEMQKQKNYQDFSHPEGKEGLQRDGGEKPYVFMAPGEQMDVSVRAGQVAKSLGSIQAAYDDGSTYTYVPPKNIQSAVDSELAGKEKESWSMAWNRLSPLERSAYIDINNTDKASNYSAMKKWMFDTFESRTDKAKTPGWKPSLRGSGSDGEDGDGSQGFSPFLDQIASVESTSTPYIETISPLQKVGNEKVFIPQANSPIKVLVKDKNGKEVFKPIYGYSGDQLESYETQKVRNINGVTFAEVRSKVPLQRFLTSGETPLLKDASIMDFGKLEYDNYEVNPAYGDIATVEKSADNADKNTGYAWITHWQRANTGPGNILLFNKAASGQKMANVAQQPTMQAIQYNDVVIRAKQMGGEAVTIEDPSTGQSMYGIRKSDGTVLDLNGNKLQ